jgi:putative SOS response-associated peptidase YedK
MCGRFEIHSALEIIAKIFGIDTVSFDYQPNYNIAPGQEVLVVVGDGKRKLALSRWGFMPSWAKELADGYKMINARAETAAEKPSFRQAFQKQRCLVVADGFYEWKKEGAAKKPYYIRLRSGRPFGFAGLYNIWKSPEGEEIRTCTIITTDSNDLIRSIHDRMPVIASPDQYDLWLDDKVHEKALLQSVLKPYPSVDLDMYAVTPKVNSPKNSSAENIQEIRG